MIGKSGNRFSEGIMLTTTIHVLGRSGYGEENASNKQARREKGLTPQGCVPQITGILARGDGAKLQPASV
jgi:hypothetical protein